MGTGTPRSRTWALAHEQSDDASAHPARARHPSTQQTLFSPDGHTLATGSDDHTVRLWNVADPAHPTPLGQPLTNSVSSVVFNSVSSVVFSPDGHTLASGSADTTVRLWGMNIDQAIQRVCALTARALTPAKWNQYLSPDLPYHPPCP